ncbi:MAG: superoxide dismutase [Candidatus Neomarinimicrobiota bacterium]|nr:superoxide dismutase [Candidatus Neomarinimicrobiota bacterium]
MSQPFTLPDLPFDENALMPTISAQTVGLHYGKHHAAYFNMLNTLSEGTQFANMSLEDVVTGSFGNPDTQKIFNNAGQAWNHILYWNQMQPGGADVPSGELASKMDDAFDGLDSFKEQFTASAVGVFGSGWCWLVEEKGRLAIMGTPNAENPLVHGKNALLGIDVWEHAYYLDYQNLRADHVKAVLDNLINWDFVADRLS